jgi:hypothetical protein
LNTISGGVSANDFYVTVPTAMIRLLESDNKTRTLASRPCARRRRANHDEPGRPDPGAELDDPVGHHRPGTTAPVTNFTYKPIGVNLQRDAARHVR